MPQLVQNSMWTECCPPAAPATGIAPGSAVTAMLASVEVMSAPKGFIFC